MLFKFLAALAVGWLGFRMWHGWGRPMPGTPKPAPPPAPPRGRDAEARAVLGVAADAGPDEIRAAHRRLIASVHPDRGGSPELTRQVNAARDTLLKNRDG
ncbi:DnaJ domain-containing protein [Sphingomonas sp.]|uniref:J domain-containing protein n=1 Tax=Sphingomonas sp. TaxID=28214 RepID=UPI001ED0B730|nr:DnaJ domain-containing protein [Sphingomonas sp.]MBX3595265.1 DnaJ domain-containing protein [Sphingomonas sp.]